MFEKLIRIDDCPPGCGVFVRHGEKELAIFHLAQPACFVVSENACPHAGGNLSSGEVSGYEVTCPTHNWKFDLKSGHCVGTDDVFLTRYTCKILGDALFVDLAVTLPIAPPKRHDFR